MMAYFLLSFGSNLGDREDNINRSYDMLDGSVCRFLRRSRFIETLAWGRVDQDKFVNSSVLAETDLSARDLLAKIHEIERQIGRERESFWGSRTIDIDILTYDKHIIRSPDLIVPHPRMHKRLFVVKTLKQIVPDFVIPGFSENITELEEVLNEDY